MLAGQLEPTCGTVLLHGHDVWREPGATSRLAGICPQHDVLWASLSAREHLVLLGRLRGLAGAALGDAVDQQLDLLGLGQGKCGVTGVARARRLGGGASSVSRSMRPRSPSHAGSGAPSREQAAGQDAGPLPPRHASGSVATRPASALRWGAVVGSKLPW